MTDPEPPVSPGWKRFSNQTRTRKTARTNKRARTSCKPDRQEKTSGIVAPWAATDTSSNGDDTNPRSRFFDGSRSESLTLDDGNDRRRAMPALVERPISAVSWPVLPD